VSIYQLSTRWLQCCKLLCIDFHCCDCSL